MQIRKALFSFDLILACTALVLLWGVIMSQVILRTVFNAPLMGGDEFTTYMIIWAIISPIGYTERVNGHIVLEELLVLFPKVIIKILRFIIRLSTLAIYILVSFSVTMFIRNSMGHITSMLRMPLWLFFTPSAIGFFWISIVCIIRNLCLLLNKEPPWAS